MNGVSRKSRTNWLGATALAGSLSLVFLATAAPLPTQAQSLFLSGGGGGGGAFNNLGGNGAGGLVASQRPATEGQGTAGAAPEGGQGGKGGSDSQNGQNTLSEPIDGVTTVTVGNGIDGTNDNYGRGGKGGDVAATVTKDITVENLILEAGAGGDSGTASGGSTDPVGVGGMGGGVRFDATGHAVTLNQSLTVSSGASGNAIAEKSRGGTVEFYADKLVVGEDKNVNLTLEQKDGDFYFQTKQLDATKGNLSIDLQGTKAWSNNNNRGVTFGELMMGMGRKVSITGDGAYTLSALTIGGEGQNSLTAADFSSATDLKFGSQSKLTFYLPEDIANGGVILNNSGTGNIIVDNAAVDLRLAGTDLRQLQAGDSINLIQGNVSGNAATTAQTVSYGAKEWNFQIATQNKNLTASLPGSTTGGGDTGTGANGGNAGDQGSGQGNTGNPGGLIGRDDGNGNIYTDNYGAVTINRDKAKAYFQSNAAALNAINFGADQIASIDDYVLPMDIKKIGEPVEGVVFLQGSGFNQTVETGSHIENDGYHLMGGAGIRYHQEQGNLLATVFIEHGDGDYDTYHASIHGKGDLSYTGGGVYAKQSWDNGWFLDGSARAGRVKRDFSSSSMVDGGFDDKSSNYYGFHIGGGKAVEISTTNKVTLNGRLLWSEIEDFSTTSHAGEYLDFDQARSVRTHLGARYEHLVTEQAKLYAGAAWEQELDGETGGKLDGFSVDKPDFSGASAVFELGGKFEAVPGMQGWTANAGVKGVAGKREEISGKVGLGYRW
ncbi:autotransporter domain-containing protein [Bartonella sp. LJL80]